MSKKEAKNWANTVIAIDPALLMDLGEFKQKVKQVCAHVKSTGERVLLPGEIEKRHYARNMSKGTLDVSTALLGKIQELAAATPQARL